MRMLKALWSARWVAIVLLLASALLAGAPDASAAPKSHAPGAHRVSGAKTRYARIRRVCPLPGRGRPTCFALLREPVASNIAASVGAKPYVPGDGASESGPAGGLTPAQLASAYEYAPTEGGTGQTVAIVDAFDDPKIEADLGEFDKKYKLAGMHDRERLLQEGRPDREHDGTAESGQRRLVTRDLPRRGDRARGLLEMQDPAGGGKRTHRRRSRRGCKRGGQTRCDRGLELLWRPRGSSGRSGV